MNALELELTPCGSVTLPMAYQQLIQGALYHIWKDTIPELHDEGYSANGRVFRMFTFGALDGRYILSDSAIRFTGPMTLEVRSPVPALLEALVESLSKKPVLWLARHRLAVVGLRCRDCLWFPPRAWIKLRTPLTLHRTLEDGSTRYFTPWEEDFYLLLAENLASKLEAARLELDPCIALSPMESSLKKRVTRFRETWITGWTGRFLLEADPETMAFLYYTGLGVGGSRGFGLFDILRPAD